MRVLVTGHHGYIGSVAAPMLLEGRPRSHRSRHLLLRRRDFLDWTRVDFPPSGMDVRDVTPRLSKASTRSCTSPRSGTIPSATSTRSRPARSTCSARRARREAKQAGVGRFVFVSSCSLYGAAGRRPDGRGGAAPVTAYAESKVLAEEALSELADDDFAPGLHAQRDRVRRLVARRLDVVLNNLAAWAYTTGRVLIMSDGTPWRPLVHVRDISRGRSRARRSARAGREPGLQRRRDRGELPDPRARRIVSETDPGLRDRVRRGRRARPAQLPRRLLQAGRVVARGEPSWTARAGARELLAAFRTGLTSEDFDPVHPPLAPQGHSSTAGKLDDALRWHHGPRRLTRSRGSAGGRPARS